jgi:hypothetical protein
VVASIMPRPGRIVLFDSRARHSARVPNKVFLQRRFTMAMKLQCTPTTPPLLLTNATYMAEEAEIRKIRNTAEGRVPGREVPRFELKQLNRDEL